MIDQDSYIIKQTLECLLNNVQVEDKAVLAIIPRFKDGKLDFDWTTVGLTDSEKVMVCEAFKNMIMKQNV